MPPAIHNALSALEAPVLQEQADDLRGRYGSIDVDALRQHVIDELGVDPLDPDQSPGVRRSLETSISTNAFWDSGV
jgi:hypothetical protein